MLLTFLILTSTWTRHAQYPREASFTFPGGLYTAGGAGPFGVPRTGPWRAGLRFQRSAGSRSPAPCGEHAPCGELRAEPCRAGALAGGVLPAVITALRRCAAWGSDLLCLFNLSSPCRHLFLAPESRLLL